MSIAAEYETSGCPYDVVQLMDRVATTENQKMTVLRMTGGEGNGTRRNGVRKVLTMIVFLV